MLLDLAIKAKLPLIKITTSDTINAKSVISHIAGKSVKDLGKITTVAPNEVYIVIESSRSKFSAPENYAKLYTKLATSESILIVVNSHNKDEVFFDAGELPVPKDLVYSLLKNVCEDSEKAQKLSMSMGGATLKEVAEYSNITMARDKSLTPSGVTKTRKEVFQGQDGLYIVDPYQSFYDPDPKLEKWVAKEKAFFFDPIDPRVTPKGLLFDGIPGCGKTAGAKYIAATWGVPLYRFDISTTKNKYVGESEANMQRNLARLDREDPCVVIFDEIEKVFASSKYGLQNTSSDLLSQLLWWLAEHKSRVLAVMTTNRKDKLPPELYREGRIDAVMYFTGVDKKKARTFIKSVAETYSVLFSELDVEKVYKTAYGKNTFEVSHATLTKMVVDQIKQNILYK